MIGNVDWTGVTAAITATCGGVAAIAGAIIGARNAAKLQTPPGAPTVGELAANTAAAVTTPPDHPTIGQIASDVANTVDAVKKAVNGAPASEPEPTK